MFIEENKKRAIRLENFKRVGSSVGGYSLSPGRICFPSRSPTEARGMVASPTHPPAGESDG